MGQSISIELLDLFESLLRAQLNTIRQLRKAAGLPEKTEKVKRISQVDLVYDVLEAHGRPMHVKAIIDQVEKAYNIRLGRDSIVSALTKRVQRQDRFVKTGPNTFGLLTHFPEGGQK